MKATYEERAMKFIDEVFSYIHNCDDVYDYESAIEEFNREHHRNVIVCWGSTRVVFVTSDYVVKTNCGTKANLRKWGTCSTELAFYKKAEEDGFAYLFVKPTEYVHESQSFLIMPRVKGIGKRCKWATDFMTIEEKDWVNNYVCDLHESNYGWKDGRPYIFDYAATI